MKTKARHLTGLLLAMLLLMAAGSALGEMKSLKRAEGNNVGVVIGMNWRNALYGGAYGEPQYYHQFPRGSNNIFFCWGWGWGPSAVFDLNGDGLCEDTTFFEGRGWTFDAGVGSLEQRDLIMSLVNSGERMSQAARRLENTRVYSSLDAEDVDAWPPEFRTGRTMDGAPIFHGAETISVLRTDSWRTNFAQPLGGSLEQSFYFLNFAESNNMVYGRAFLRNMSEYVQYNESSQFSSRAKQAPNGFTWVEMTMASCIHTMQAGSEYPGWIYHPARQITGFYQIAGIEPTFTPKEAPIIGQMMTRYPSHNGETMHLTNFNLQSEDYGFNASQDVMVGGFPRGMGYRWQLGDINQIRDLFPGITNPFTGKPMFGFPGRLDPDDARYNQWLWGADSFRHYTAFGILHDIAPRDTVSFDFVYMWCPVAAGKSYAMPPRDIANMDDPGMQEACKPLEVYADVALAVAGGDYVLPETPAPPAMTIIPGDRQVTITWNDANLYVPDAYYYFLQKNPDLDPNHVYKEYDFEGYRLYRSFVGPSDTHSELIYQSSVSDKNLGFYYVDQLNDDIGKFRMRNGLKVWYALVPYDKNYDPATGDEFSLPTPESGKVWNRPGSGLYTVIPRSDASNFKSASVEDVKFVSSWAGETLDVAFVKLAGANFKLTEAPKAMKPPVYNLDFVTVNAEKLTQDKTISVVCDSRIYRSTNCPGNFLVPICQFSVHDGSSHGPSSTELNARGAAEQNLTLASPLDADGVAYSVEMTFSNMDVSNNVFSFYGTVDQGNYTGATVDIVTNRWCGPTTYAGSAPSNVGMCRSGRFQVTWKNSSGQMTAEVKDLSRGVDLPFVEYPDDYGWGIQTKEGFGGSLGNGGDENRGVYFNEAFVDMVPKSERTVKMLKSLPQDNDQLFAFWVNGILWRVSRDGDDGITMPSDGTVWTIDNAFGTWNDEGTQFTQVADMPWQGDRWDIQLKGTTMNAEDADMGKIRVVPNPYMASSFLDLSPSSRRIEFTNLPNRCTIRIYTLGGNLVNVLNHIGANRQGWGNYLDWDRLDGNSNPRELTGWDNHSGTEPWNLRNRFGQTVASGLYLYHVTDARGKTHMGKFYIVN